MGTGIKTWQIIDGQLKALKSSLQAEGRKESQHLEKWIASYPEIIGDDILIIGRQVRSASGRIDLLGVDKSGNAVIIELKRDVLPRECLAQAIDYASDVAQWDVERLSEVCLEYSQKGLEEAFEEAFPNVDLEELNVNNAQRIILIGFSIGSSLQRMVEWLSDTYAVNANAILLSYVKTSSGDELLTKTTIIPEEVEQQRARKRKKFKIPMSDEPGSYDGHELKAKLTDYLSRNRVTIRRIRDILLPACLKTNVLTRDELKKEFVAMDPSIDESKVGTYLTTVSTQLGMERNDFLRQVVSYEYPEHYWEKDNFSIREEHRGLVKEVLGALRNKESDQEGGA